METTKYGLKTFPIRKTKRRELSGNAGAKQRRSNFVVSSQVCEVDSTKSRRTILLRHSNCRELDVSIDREGPFGRKSIYPTVVTVSNKTRTLCSLLGDVPKANCVRILPSVSRTTIQALRNRIGTSVNGLRPRNFIEAKDETGDAALQVLAWVCQRHRFTAE